MFGVTWRHPQEPVPRLQKGGIMDDLKPTWGQWFGSQAGLLVALGIVVGFALWLARHELMVGIVIGCMAFVIGGVIGGTRLERWLDAKDEAGQ